MAEDWGIDGIIMDYYGKVLFFTFKTYVFQKTVPDNI